MTRVSVLLEPAVASFYMHLAEVVGVSLEQILTDALFKLAGELSLEALRNRE